MSAAEAVVKPLPNEEIEPIGAGRGLLIALMFLVSGAAGLIYEVVWTRQLTTLFGATIYAVSTVLTAFMGGLALGSWLIGRVADRVKRPLVVYGFLELGIGGAALAFPFLLKIAGPIVGSFYATGGEGTFFAFSLLRFVIAGVLLLIPTTLMGATLPIMSRAVTRDLKSVGHLVGGLYALNTLGAVLGVFLTGFALLEALGIWKTTLVAVSVNVLVACIAMLLGRSLNAPAEKPQETASQSGGEGEYPATIVKVVLVSYALSGLIALAYQIAWTRALIFSFEALKATTYSFAGMLTVFLLGLAIGSAVMQSRVDKIKDPLAVYGLIQLLLGVTGALSIFLMHYDPPERLLFTELSAADPSALNYWGAVANVMTRTAMAIGLPTLLMGMAFPLVTRIAVRHLKSLGREIGHVYALNTLGAIIGSFLGGFVLIPLMGITNTICLLSTVGLLIGASMIIMNPRVAGSHRMAIGAGLLVAVGVFSFSMTTKARGLKYHQLTLGESLVHYDEGPLATVSVIQDSKGWRTIYVDAIGVAGTDPVLQTDQKTLAHVPMLLLGGEAESVLTVGFGSGGASYSYTLYPGVKDINAIEITPSVPRAARVLTDANHGIVYTEDVLKAARKEKGDNGFIDGAVNPISKYTVEAAPDFFSFDDRYHIILDDARAFLRFTDKVFDVIATDCTDLRYKSNANLYDLEYFQLCRERISDRGLVVVWVPLGGLSDEAFRITVRTFHEVFPDMTVWYFTNQPTHYCLFIGQKGGLKIDYNEVLKGLANPAIQTDLEEIGLREPAKVVASFVTDNRGIDGYLGEGPLNTEDTPVLEFLSPRWGYGPSPIAINMGRLYDVQVPVMDLAVESTPETERDKDKIARYQTANVILFEGHVAYRNFEFMDACRKYEEALKVAPEDEAIKKLLDFEELKLLCDWELKRPVSEIDGQWVNAQWVAFGLGNVFHHQKRYSDAVSILAPYAQRTPPANRLSQGNESEELRRIGYSINLLLARCYAAVGNTTRAKEFLAMAKEYMPSRPDWNETEKSVLSPES